MLVQPAGFDHCDDIGHQIKRLTHEDGKVTEHCMRTIHAEQNAICQAARQGISIEGSTIYTRMTPCRTCAMLIINCGIKRVVCERRYHAGEESEAMFIKAGIDLEFKYNELQKILKLTFRSTQPAAYTGTLDQRLGTYKSI